MSLKTDPVIEYLLHQKVRRLKNILGDTRFFAAQIRKRRLKLELGSKDTFPQYAYDQTFESWVQKVTLELIEIFGNNLHAAEFYSFYSYPPIAPYVSDNFRLSLLEHEISQRIPLLESMITEVESSILPFPEIARICIYICSINFIYFVIMSSLGYEINKIDFLTINGISALMKFEKKHIVLEI